MPLLERIFTGNEELGKKDDDHRPRNTTTLPSSWVPRLFGPAFRRRRVFYSLIALLIVYIFIENIPSDLAPDSRHGDTRALSRSATLRSSRHQKQSHSQPPRSSKPSKSEEHYYDGQIKFYNLAASLHAVARLSGHGGANKNVLFAASNLKSASEIIPLACEMAVRKRNNVHFALMGRDDFDISEIKSLNGVSDEDCKVHWHDARPDYAPWSSDFRMEVSVTASLGHIQTFIRPQVILIDTASREDWFFIKSVKAKASEMNKSVIELPPDASESLMWLSHLDSNSLKAWHMIYIDLVIHAPPQSSGSLLRLLKSIQTADYFGSRRPHITIELPAEIDPPAYEFLENWVWPPIDSSGTSHASQVTLRHRIPRHGFTTEEASTHFIESFYPARPKDSHVLLLSPQVELSPTYYHYLIYHLLEYKYSARAQREPHSVIGISLDLPTTYLDDIKNLEPPILTHKETTNSSLTTYDPTSFLWQAPNSNAALYFGEKWVELHSFLSARIALQDPDLPADQRPPNRQRVISENYPSWMEYVLELMRIRGYSLLYPGLPLGSDAIVTVHEELYHSPEEYKPKHPRASASSPIPTLDPQDPFTTNPYAHSPSAPTHSESPLLVSNLLSVLPETENLPALGRLPILSYEGEIVTPSRSESIATKFADSFRREIGRCDDAHMAKISEDIKPVVGVADLFCNLEGFDEQPITGESSSKDFLEEDPDQPDEGQDQDHDNDQDKGEYQRVKESSEEADKNPKSMVSKTQIAGLNLSSNSNKTIDDNDSIRINPIGPLEPKSIKSYNVMDDDNKGRIRPGVSPKVEMQSKKSQKKVDNSPSPSQVLESDADIQMINGNMVKKTASDITRKDNQASKRIPDGRTDQQAFEEATDKKLNAYDKPNAALAGELKKSLPTPDEEETKDVPGKPLRVGELADDGIQSSNLLKHND